jgi:hypothetical protein
MLCEAFFLNNKNFWLLTAHAVSNLRHGTTKQQLNNISSLLFVDTTCQIVVF